MPNPENSALPGAFAQNSTMAMDIADLLVGVFKQ
jgi:hypothetical protein